MIDTAASRASSASSTNTIVGEIAIFSQLLMMTPVCDQVKLHPRLPIFFKWSSCLGRSSWNPWPLELLPGTLYFEKSHHCLVDLSGDSQDASDCAQPNTTSGSKLSYFHDRTGIFPTYCVIRFASLCILSSWAKASWWPKSLPSSRTCDIEVVPDAKAK
jgi:hypothetical protein